MPLRLSLSRSLARSAVILGLVISAVHSAAAQQFTVETRDPKQKQDDSFAKDYKTALANPKHSSPLVDHLPLVAGIPTPKDVLKTKSDKEIILGNWQPVSVQAFGQPVPQELIDLMQPRLTFLGAAGT